MYCTACQYFDQTCRKSKIYASGYIKECPFYGTGEPVISSMGSNFQIMTETINHLEGLERIDITPLRNPGKLTWYTKIMICYNGHGTVTTTDEEITLAGIAIWVAWQKALLLVKQINSTGLNHLIPLIEERIKFNYSMVQYSPVKELLHKTGIQPEEPVKAVPPKPTRIIIPKHTEYLLDVQIPDNAGRSAGDQMDLFAV